MVGLTRQGVVCEVCGFACHIRCKDRVPAACPVPPDQTKRPLGIDPTRGIGTAYEGYVKVPKPGGVKKGWQRQFVVVCDFKLFLYELQAAAPTVAVSQVLDMRDPEFEVSSVRESDVIHAAKKDVPCIFRVTTSLMDPPGIRHQCLMLADSESEKTKWVVALNELHRILKKNKLPDRTVYRCKEVMDNTVTVIKNALSATPIDRDRLTVGTEDGLFCVDLERDEIGRIGEGKKIYQVEYLLEEQLIIVLAGRQRQAIYPHRWTPHIIPLLISDETDPNPCVGSDGHGVDQGGGHKGLHCFCHRNDATHTNLRTGSLSLRCSQKTGTHHIIFGLKRKVSPVVKTGYVVYDWTS